MTEKEKAKAYDEVLKKASAAHKDEDRHLKATLERIFPELKEDDDERIKKELIQWVDEFPDIIWRGHYKKDIIAWLEKQGDKSLPQTNERAWLYLVSDVLTWKDGIGQYLDDPRVQELAKRLCSEYAQKLYNSSILSNSSNTGKNEQKSVDKIEPRFKVGDWIITPENKVLQITSIEGTSYRFNNESHYWEFCYCDEQCHLWTIEDAKDGDVLALSWLEDKNLWEKIIIFKKYHSEGIKGICSMSCVEGYGNTFKNGKLAFTDEEVPYHSKTWTWNLHPATKEQRDLLFQKIKEAGYEWDADKKELKKLDLVPNKKPILEGLKMKTYNDINIGDTVYIWGTSDSSVDETTITEKYDDRGHWNLKFSNGCVGRALKNGTSSTMGMYACLVYSDKEAVRESINEQIKILSNIKI